jgi:arginase family enzyme
VVADATVAGWLPGAVSALPPDAAPRWLLSGRDRSQRGWATARRREAEGMGDGPLVLAKLAATAFATSDVRRISRADPATTEVAACFDLNRQLAGEVAAARANDVLPVVLTGNCHSQQAVVAGLGSDRLGLAGVRDVEPGECERLDRSAIHRVAARDIARLPDQLEHVQAERISLHVDLDVLDPTYGRANAYAVAPGITGDELIGAVGAVARARELAALTVSAYDPSYDRDGRVRDAALALFHAVASA